MDVIWGQPTEVIDGDTFDIEVTHYLSSNDYEYGGEERVRVQGIDAPELPGPGGRLAKRDLKRCIMGNEVKLHIHSRDKYGRLIADVLVAA